MTLRAGGHRHGDCIIFTEFTVRGNDTVTIRLHKGTKIGKHLYIDPVIYNSVNA